MPSRLLREGILDSEAVNELSFPAEVFYRRLMSVVDDFGRFDGRPSVLRSRLYPLRVESVREADISRWIAECEKAGLLVLYAVNGAGSSRWIATCEKAGLAASKDERVYVLFHKLGSPRAKESKYPAPPDGKGRPPSPNQSDSKHMFADVSACKQPQTDESTPERVKTDAPYSGSYSGTGSGSDSTDRHAGVGRSVGRADEPGPVPFDPLRAEEEARKLFERRWNEAGLRKFSRLNHTLRAALAERLRDSWWAENYPAALAKAGRIPFLATGVGRQRGALDVSEFLTFEDECRKIIDGVRDPTPAATGHPPAAKKMTVGEFIAMHKKLPGTEAA